MLHSADFQAVIKAYNKQPQPCTLWLPRRRVLGLFHISRLCFIKITGEVHVKGGKMRTGDAA